MKPIAHSIAFALLALLAALCAAAPAARAQQAAPEAPAEEPRSPAEKIVEIRVEGAGRVDPEAIRRALHQKVGDFFRPEDTRDDIKSLWALGFFADVRLLVQRLPRGLVYVVQVQERPAVREVRLSGNQELSTEDFKETLDIKPGAILDLDQVKKNEKKIQEKYVEKGYFLAEVQYRVEPATGAGEVDVVYDIREHAKVAVKEISFIGVDHVPVEEIKSYMATKEGNLLSFMTSEGTFRQELFDRDMAVLQGVFYDHGFINVKVDKPVLTLSADKRFIFITIKVEEGDRYTVGKLDFSGDLELPKEQLRTQMVSGEGETFNRSKLGQDILKITDVYHDRGYAYANITPLTQVHAEDKVIDLTFDVQKGKKVYIERIEIGGNTKTMDKVIRRELRAFEGDLFSGTRLRLSKERVTALGFFETVEVSQRAGSDDSHVVVQVDVKEKPTGTFQLGFGFSNVESFILTGQVSQNNIFGWGQTFSASVQWSALRNLIQVSYFDPYFLDTEYIFALDAYRIEAEYPDFLRLSTGGTLNLGYHVTEDVMANLAYTYEHVNVEPGPSLGTILLADRFRSGVTSSLRLSATWDRRDNRLFPSKGFMHFASVEAAPKEIGGTFEFMRYTAYSRFYVPLPYGLVFKVNGTIGYIQSLNPNKALPISEMYFLGGINTIRGYFLRSISPTMLVAGSDRPDASTTTFYVGGNKQLIFNIEVEFPIFEKAGLRGVVFYDAGNAFSENEMFFQDKHDRHVFLGMFHAVGFGFRWFSPIGPLRFEWGVPLTKRPTDQPINFEFTIGNFF